MQEDGPSPPLPRASPGLTSASARLQRPLLQVHHIGVRCLVVRETQRGVEVMSALPDDVRPHEQRRMAILARQIGDGIH